MRFPKLRYWISGTAILGGFMTLYSVWAGFVQMPREAGDLKWLALAIGIGLSLAVWHSLAQASENREKTDRKAEKANQKAEESAQETKVLLQTLVARETLGSRIVEQNDVTHSVLLRLHKLYEDKTASTGTGSIAVSPSLSGTGNVTVVPGTGELTMEGFPPTVSGETALDREIRDQEAVVLRHLRLKLEPGIFHMTGNPVRLIVSRNDGTTEER